MSKLRSVAGPDFGCVGAAVDAPEASILTSKFTVSFIM